MTNQELAAAILDHNPAALDTATVVANWLLTILSPEDLDPLASLGSEAVDTIEAAIRTVREAELERLERATTAALFDLEITDMNAFVCV